MRPPLRFTYSSPGGGYGPLGTVRAHMEDEEGRSSIVGAMTFHGPTAWADVDEEAGTMISTAQARIVDAGVAEPFQRMGIGSEMHRIASREMGPGITLGHSGSLSPEGHAFAKATGGDIPRSAQKGPTIEERGPYYPSFVASSADEIAVWNPSQRRVEGSPPPPSPSPGPRTRRSKQLELDL